MRTEATRGFSLLEALLALGALLALLLIGAPRLARVRAQAMVGAAREAFVATHGLARQVAAQYGRIAELQLDPSVDAFWVSVDTSSRPGVEVRDTVHAVVWVGKQFSGVEIEGKQRLLCFDPRGVATARGACELPNATIVFRLGGVADTVTLSRLGRVLRR